MKGKGLVPLLLIFGIGLTDGFSQPVRSERASVELSRRKPPLPQPGKTGVLQELSDSLESISEHSGPAVVEIFARAYSPGNSDNGGALLTSQNSSASGVLLSSDGYILTNAHAVRGAHSLRVHLTGRRMGKTQTGSGLSRRRGLTAALVGMDPETDLAVIKVEGTNFPYLEFADSDPLKQGQLVLALGNPLGLDNSVSLGVVSAVSRQMKPDDALAYIQTDAPINPGNSGGPLLDAQGRVIGTNTFIMTQSGGSEGMGFAIPSNVATLVYEQLKAQGHVHRAKLGLVVQTINPFMADGLSLETDRGVIVSDVEPDGPAVSAGVKPDDIILAINGKKVRSVRQLEATVFRQRPGETITLRVQRGAGENDVLLKTREESDDWHALADTLDPIKSAVPELGIVGIDITKPLLQSMPDLRRPEGVVVALCDVGGSYAGPPLAVGDVIYELNRHVIANLAELRQALGPMKPGDAAVLLVERAGRLYYLSLELN